MDSEQTSSIPLFLRRVGNGEKSSTRTMKLVFSGEESASGGMTICPEIKVNDLPCAYTVSDMVLLSPTLNNQGFLLDIDGEDELHGRRLGSRIRKESGSDDQRKDSRAMMSLPYSDLQQKNKDPRNSSVDSSKNLLLPKNSEPVGNTTGGVCPKTIIWPLDKEEQPKVGDGRMTQIRMRPSPFYHPRASRERTLNPFLRVFLFEGSPVSPSDSDSSANGSPSGFFQTRFRSRCGSYGGSVSGSSTSTTPSMSPSGDFRELTWDDDPFTIKRKNEKIKSKPPISPDTISIIENELQRSSLTDKVLTPIEIEAKERYEQRVKRKKERERKLEERFFF